MKWIFFLVICPATSMDFCEPRWNNQVFETKVECEQALKTEAAAYESDSIIVMQAGCQQKKEEKTPKKAN